MKPFYYFIFCLLIITSCKQADVNCEDTDYNYTVDIKPIIDKNCNVAGCHNGKGNIGNFSTYQGLKPVLDNGEFEHRVFIKKDMPRFRILSLKNKNKLRCWMENGFKEN